MNLQPIFHALAWTLFMEVADAYDSNKTRSGMTYEVYDRSIFMHYQTHRDYDRAFALLMQQGLLVERRQRTQPHCIDYDLTLSAGTLREHIELAGLIDGTPTEELVRCFLSLSSVNGGVKSCHAAAQKSATCGARMRPPGGLRPERGSHARVAIFEGRQPAFRARLWARR